MSSLGMGNTGMLQLGETSSNDKAKFIVGNQTVVAQFNPNVFEISTEGKYNLEKLESNNTKLQFLGIKPKTLSIELFFDTSEIKQVYGTTRQESSVKDKTDELEAFVHKKPSKHTPPQVKFVWGSLSFIGYVTSVKTTFTLFTKTGIPIRAKVVVTMQNKFEEPKEKANQSPDRTKTRVLSEDISIWSLAKSEYGDMNEWRRIAKANNILNPFEIESGRVLELPAITEEE